MLGELSISPLEAFLHSVPTASHLSSVPTSSRRERTLTQSETGFRPESVSSGVAGTSRGSTPAGAMTGSNRGSSRALFDADAHTSDTIAASSTIRPGSDRTATMSPRAEVQNAGSMSKSSFAKADVGRLQTHDDVAQTALSSSMSPGQSQQHRPEAAEEVKRSLVSSRSSVKDGVALLESQQQPDTAVQRYMACTTTGLCFVAVELRCFGCHSDCSVHGIGAVSVCLCSLYRDTPT